jgi:hypothetical protein
MAGPGRTTTGTTTKADGVIRPKCGAQQSDLVFLARGDLYTLSRALASAGACGSGGAPARCAS